MPRLIEDDKTLSVSSEQVNEFLKQLHEADFWSLPTAKFVYGHDGEEWLLEGKRNDKYHVVDRWSGSMEATYSRACNSLQELPPFEGGETAKDSGRSSRIGPNS
jgi:hypothetical protein